MTESTRPRPFAFVLMPFSQEFLDTYELGIKQACEEAGAYCERVDEQIFDESILQRIYNQIAKADILISDMTGRNPNVFYETGYAHALGKRVILLTKSAADIPFDLKPFSHVIYEGKITSLKNKLKSRVEWCIANPLKHLTTANVAVELRVNGNKLENKPTIVCKNIRLEERFARIEIQVHNIGNSILHSANCSLGMIVQTYLSQLRFKKPFEELATGIGTYEVSKIDSKSQIIELPLSRTLLPDTRHTLVLALGTDRSWETDAMIRMFTEFGPSDFEFHIQCKSVID